MATGEGIKDFEELVKKVNKQQMEKKTNPEEGRESQKPKARTKWGFFLYMFSASLLLLHGYMHTFDWLF